jgi:hypothetical protein
MMADRAKIDIDGHKYTAKRANAALHPSDILIDGIKYTINMARCSATPAPGHHPVTTYHVSTSRHTDKTGTLIDHGANGGIAGSDCCIIKEMSCCVNIEGINNHVMEKCPIITAGTITNLNQGPVILIMNQYALSGKGTSIHSSPQMEWYDIDVDDKSMKVGGKQQLQTVDGYTIPLNVQRGLPYLDMHPYTDKEWEELPHIHITHEEDWDPSVLDHEQSNDHDWYDQQPSTPLLFPMFDEHGDLRHCIEAHTSRASDNIRDNVVRVEDSEDAIFMDARCDLIEDGDEISPDLNESMEWCLYQANLHCLVHSVDAQDSNNHFIPHHPCTTLPSDHDYEALKPCFAWLPSDIIRKTFSETMQYARLPFNTVLRKCYKSPNPALNIMCCSEPIATDTIQSDTPAINGRETYAQIFVGTCSLVTDMYGMKSPAQFPGTLADNIMQHGAPTQ